ncbi:hypothetical protein SAMN05192583_3732 [Sphingomonas gellani]|uniref:Uncharacterized protein n=1 Tax=Sphingomonas gellani TaxID=1166340 RepID=A0A1H8K0Z9_9SPHN|nr:hypothetical protein [Sphingomonas gellani]SEN86196.1 hypothetical protein SAMN05192583_3732 [Sphingomonas gellani]
MNAAFYRAGPQARVPEAAMPNPRRARSLHRRIATLFTLAVAANFAVMPWGSPPVWITYAPLPPLLFLLATGLVMLVSPWVLAVRRARHGGVR